MKYSKETPRGCSKCSPMESSPDPFPETTESEKLVTVSWYTEIISCLPVSFCILSKEWRWKGSWTTGYQVAGVYTSLKPMESLGRDLDLTWSWLFRRQKVSRESKRNMNLILLAGIHWLCSTAAPALASPSSSSVPTCLAVALLQFVFSLGDQCLSSSFIMKSNPFIFKDLSLY